VNNVETRSEPSRTSLYSFASTATTAQEVCLLAGRLAFRTYDTDLALRFFDVAREAAGLSNIELGIDFELAVAEAQLRSGALDNALQRLALVDRRTPDPVARAHALSRVAWAEMQIDVDRVSKLRAWPQTRAR
jgi:hypothetical protein